MDGIKLQEKIYKGYAIAAKHIGLAHTVYRSTTAIDPIVSGNIIATNFFASFNVNWSYMQANKYGNAVWQCVCDGRIANVGDYLVNDRTWFIIAEQHLLPILAVECNAIATTIERPGGFTQKGSVGYMEAVKPRPTTLTVIGQNIPISVLLDSRGEGNPVNLPMDSKWGRWLILIPYLGNVEIKVSDIINVGEESYQVDSPELTDFGWRIRARRVKT